MPSATPATWGLTPPPDGKTRRPSARPGRTGAITGRTERGGDDEAGVQHRGVSPPALGRGAGPDFPRWISLRGAPAPGPPGVAPGEGRRPPDMPEADVLAIIRERLRQLLPVAEEARVLLTMEPHGTISLSPGGLARIMELVSSPGLGVNFDTGNQHLR